MPPGVGRGDPGRAHRRREAPLYSVTHWGRAASRTPGRRMPVPVRPPVPLPLLRTEPVPPRSALC